MKNLLSREDLELAERAMGQFPRFFFSYTLTAGREAQHQNFHYYDET